MPRSMFPWDLEESVIWTDPLQTWVPAAVHLRHQPRLETNAARLHTHDLRSE